MRKTILLFLVLLISPNALGQNNENPAEFIMKAVSQRAVENEKIKEVNTEYKRRYVIENLDRLERPFIDRQGQSIKKRNEVELVSKGIGRIIERNGRPVSEKSSSMPNINFSRALAFYDFSMAETPIIMENGRAYHVINFRPNKNARPKGDMEEILARMAGNIYIDVEKLFIYKLNTSLTKEYSRGWFVYRLGRADIALKQMEFQDMIVVESLVIIDKYYIFGSGTFERQTLTYADYIYRP